MTRCCLSCGAGIAPAKTSVLPPGVLRHRGRGLCNRCWRREKRAGRLDDWPASIASGHPACTDGTCEWCQEVLWIAAGGSSPYEWADRMGTNIVAMSRRLYRHGLVGLARQTERIRGEQRRALRRAS